MNADNKKWHVPTSDELEEQGAISPAVGAPSAQRRRGLRKFFRAGRFRVPEDVGVNKHVGSVPVRQHPIPPSPRQPQSPPGPAERTSPSHVLPDNQEAQVPTESIRRTIRIDQSVKDRRGMGGN